MPGLLLRRLAGHRRRFGIGGAALLVLLGITVPAGPPALAAAAPPAPPPVCVIPGADEADRPATDLRVALGRLLGEHAYLLMEAMRSEAAQAPDAAATRGRLDGNSDALAEAIGSVYGDQAGGLFRLLWQTHVDASAAYARASATGDQAGTEAALRQLRNFQTELDTFLSNANPQLDADAEAQAVRLHLEHLQGFAAGDYAGAYRAAREAYGHMFELGDMLARAIAHQFPDRFPDERIAFSPSSELRVTLDRLLGEHLVLAAEAMRAGVTNAPDFAAARQALDANSGDLRGAVGSVYGDEAGGAFGEIWTAHIVAYLDYIEAVQSEDQARMDAARTTLEGYGAVLGEFLAGANPELEASGVADLVGHHTSALLAMVDQYRAGDHEAAYATVGEAYAHMFTVGDALAGAISAQFPDRFDDMEELPRTDVGASDHHGDAIPAGAPILALALAAAVAILTPAVERRLRDRRSVSPRD